MEAGASFCPKCGKPALSGASFCAYCGAELPRLEQAVSPKADRRAIRPPERDALVGPCCVIHTGKHALDIRAVGRIVAEETEMPLSDVTRRMRTTKGFVALELDAEKAIALAKRIETQLGLPMLTLPMADCLALPPPMRMREVAIGADGLTCQAYTWDETVPLAASWDEVFLISCGRLDLERVTEREKTRAPSRNLFDRMVPELQTDRYAEYVIDLVLFDPWRRLRLDHNSASYALRDQESLIDEKLAALRECGRSLLHCAETVPVGPGLPLLASHAADWEWEPLSFLSKLDFDSYTHWLMQLVRYGYSIAA